jgi:hypothetical protein
MDFKIRILQGIGLTDKLQYKTKNVWYDGSTTENGRRTWSKWQDVVVAKLESNIKFERNYNSPLQKRIDDYNDLSWFKKLFGDV